MARFFAGIQGSRGEATRLGCTASGMVASVMSWTGMIHVRMHNVRRGKDDIDWVLVTLQPHPSQGCPTNGVVTLYDGPCDAWREYAEAGELGRLAWRARAPLSIGDKLTVVEPSNSASCCKDIHDSRNIIASERNAA
jgi:hypothetical protein